MMPVWSRCSVKFVVELGFQLFFVTVMWGWLVLQSVEVSLLRDFSVLDVGFLLLSVIFW